MLLRIFKSHQSVVMTHECHVEDQDTNEDGGYVLLMLFMIQISVYEIHYDFFFL